MLHRDPSVWGPEPEKFNPDNFSREAEAARPPNAFKPWGNGQRACIGRQFAMQEATLVIGMLLQRFQLFDHKKYQLKIKESLSIKPDGFTLKVKPRPGRTRSALVPGAAVANQNEAPSREGREAAEPRHEGDRALRLQSRHHRGTGPRHRQFGGAERFRHRRWPTSIRMRRRICRRRAPSSSPALPTTARRRTMRRASSNG